MKKVYRFIAELSRRKVLHTTGAYIVVVWLLAQGFADLFPAFGLPDWAIQVFVIGGVAAIPVVALVAWRFELTRHGLLRDPGLVTPALPAVAADTIGAGVVAIVWTDADGRPQERRFFQPLVVGRDPACDITLPDKRVSRRHSMIYIEERRWWLRDLDSSNGTFLDGERVSIVPLPARAQLRLHPEGPQLDVRVESEEETLVSMYGHHTES